MFSRLFPPTVFFLIFPKNIKPLLQFPYRHANFHSNVLPFCDTFRICYSWDLLQTYLSWRQVCLQLFCKSLPSRKLQVASRKFAKSQKFATLHAESIKRSNFCICLCFYIANALRDSLVVWLLEIYPISLTGTFVYAKFTLISFLLNTLFPP